MAEKGEKIVLGSGLLYVTEYSGGVLPERDVIEVETNLLGLIQGGATLEYKPAHYTATDDLGKVKKTILIKEEAILKSGIMTWCGDTLKKLCSTARVTEAEGKRIVKIGGLLESDGKQYIISFVHKDTTDGDVVITIVGSNQAGFSLAFAKDKETVIDAEFMASPHDSEGTLILYEEDVPEITI